jgi:hypothetical protein
MLHGSKVISRGERQAAYAGPPLPGRGPRDPPPPQGGVPAAVHASCEGGGGAGEPEGGVKGGGEGGEERGGVGVIRDKDQGVGGGREDQRVDQDSSLRDHVAIMGDRC